MTMSLSEALEFLADARMRSKRFHPATEISLNDSIATRIMEVKVLSNEGVKFPKNCIVWPSGRRRQKWACTR